MPFKNTTYEHILKVEKAYLGVVSGANIKHMGYIAFPWTGPHDKLIE